jgi:hypothetical protein
LNVFNLYYAFLSYFIQKGYAVHHRIDRLERKIVEHDKKFDLLIKTSTHPLNINNKDILTIDENVGNKNVLIYIQAKLPQ